MKRIAMYIGFGVGVVLAAFVFFTSLILFFVYVAKAVAWIIGSPID